MPTRSMLTYYIKKKNTLVLQSVTCINSYVAFNTFTLHELRTTHMYKLHKSVHQNSKA